MESSLNLEPVQLGTNQSTAASYISYLKKKHSWLDDAKRVQLANRTPPRPCLGCHKTIKKCMCFVCLVAKRRMPGPAPGAYG
jgi:hypothetical protein